MRLFSTIDKPNLLSKVDCRCIPFPPRTTLDKDVCSMTPNTHTIFVDTRELTDTWDPSKGCPRRQSVWILLSTTDHVWGRTLVSHLDIHWEHVIWENTTCVSCRPHQKVRNIPVRERKMQRKYCMTSRTCQMRTCRSRKWWGNKDTSIFRSGVMVCERFKSWLTVCTRVGDHRGRSRIVQFLSLVFHHTDTPRRVTYKSLLFSSHFIVS
jgi:hypothetical protein